MPYSKFTIEKAKNDFQLTLVEGSRFFPAIEPIIPSQRLASELEDLPWTIAVGSEKARSESYHVRSITHDPKPGHGIINVICLSEKSMMPCPYATIL